ncbi:hypothetical protein [Natrialba sp. INN-245]|uniref:hypothetical protein n=1 Tax=Natrialba sp. INN-245 TaxID=2690967 RepID=UPI001357FCDF|nr:hypothetical protein [Natrialba sp. INN-245]
MVSSSHIHAIGRTELRRQWRAVQENPTQLVALLFVGIFFVPMALAGLAGAFFFGDSIASGSLESPGSWGRLVLVYTWLFAVGFGGYRAYSTALRPDRLDGMLTTVSHREFLGGLVYSEVLLWGIPAVVYSALASIAFAAGARSVVALPFSFGALVIALSTALAAGHLVALAVRNAGVRSRLLTRLRTVVFILIGLVYFALIFTQNFAAVLDPLFWLLEPTPVGWYGELALVGTASDVSLGRAAGAVVSSGVFLLVCAFALPRLAELLWYADGVHVEHEVESTADSSTAESRLAAVVPRPAVGVVWVDWKRARRAPITLSFVLYPLIFLVNPVLTVFRTGTVGSSFPLWVALCSAWITGALFSLNVVGNEGAVLPTTLLSGEPGRAVVIGHAFAGAALVAPVAVPATLVLSLLSPHAIGTAVSLTLGTAVLVACAGPIATGIGAIFPKFEAVNVSRSTRAVVPSVVAFGVFSVVLCVVAVPMLAGHSVLFGGGIASLLGTSHALVAAAGTVVTAAIALPVGALSARYAIRTVESYHVN